MCFVCLTPSYPIHVSDSLRLRSLLADQTPPRKELRNSDPNVKDQSLYQLQLAPSSVLHLMFRDDSLNRLSPSMSVSRLTFDRLPRCEPPRPSGSRGPRTRKGPPRTSSCARFHPCVNLRRTGFAAACSRSKQPWQRG